MTEPQPKTITKKELANRIAEATDQPKVVVKDILQRFLDGIIEELVAGNRLEFREFGVFEVRERAPRRAQNPRTLEKVEVPAKRVVKFKVGRLMRDRVCEEPDGNAGKASASGATSSAAGYNNPAAQQAGSSPENSDGSTQGKTWSSPEAPSRPEPPKPPPAKPDSPF